jgi:hypothetical protein
MKALVVIPAIVSILILGTLGLSSDAWAPTKIAPTEASTPHPFTIIDTPDGRLSDGAVAIFTLSGSQTIIPLKTQKPFMTAQGQLPNNIEGGTYEVSFLQPGGTEIPVGIFKVIGEPDS